MNIKNAYDAYWFLLEHPKMRCRTMIISSGDKPSRNTKLKRIKDEYTGESVDVYEWTNLFIEALEVNLSIFYTLVDDDDHINNDKVKNRHIRCWLEFGSIKQAICNGQIYTQHWHDPKLDCGAPTFDEALIKLARLVKKHYGDYKKSA